MATKKTNKQSAKKPTKKGGKRGMVAAAIQKNDAPVSIAPLNVTEYRIASASITKERTLNVTYKKLYDGAASNHVFEECGNEVHADLQHAFLKLKPHYVLINDMKESEVKGRKLDPSDFENEVLENIKVTGFILKLDGETKKSITLVGQKKIGNRVGCWNTPNLKFDDAQFPYEEQDHLMSVLMEIDAEIHLYFGGKFAPASQQALELEEGEVETEEIAEEN